MVNVSALGGDCGVARSDVTTRAASYSTAISRIEVQSPTASERVTHTTTSWSLGRWKLIQRKLSGACCEKREEAAARKTAMRTGPDLAMRRMNLDIAEQGSSYPTHLAMKQRDG